MDILNKPINSFSFDDIVAFCQEGHIEGVQLDYKRELSKKGLAKDFAAFSNTRGGVIIIGVDENKKTSAPKAWDGVDNDGKLVDRIHQYAANVEPLPVYEVNTTDEHDGKVFLLARIFEGDRTPYYVQNDATLWVRTGNIKTPVDIASPDATELLFGKKEKARLARDNYLNRAQETYEAALKAAEKDRLIQIARAEEREEGSGASYLQSPLGTQSSMCTIVVQPFYPGKALISLTDLLQALNDMRVRNNRSYREFPRLGIPPITVQDGVLKFDWKEKTGWIEAVQVYAGGLVYHSEDILFVENNSNKSLLISHIAENLFIFLKSAAKFYRIVGYQGGVEGYLKIEKVEGVRVEPIIPGGFRRHTSDRRTALRQAYKWEVQIDTSVLNDDKEFQFFFLEKIQEVNWSLGYASENEKVLEAFLKQNGWLVE